jgi:hypothetical protein
MTFDERFSLLQATKPLPLTPQPAARRPGSIQNAILTMLQADRMIAYHQRAFAEAQRLILEAVHATP